MRIFFIVLVVLATAATGYAERALKPKTLPGFTNVSAVQTGTPWDMNVQPAMVTWSVTTFGGFTSFELGLDVSIGYPCSTADYYPISTLTGDSTVLSRGVTLSGERCLRPNLRTKAGTGGVTSIKLNMRGLQ